MATATTTDSCDPHDTPGEHLDDESTLSRANTVNDSASFAKHSVTEEIHPAFDDVGIRYDTSGDYFAAEEPEDLYDESAIFNSQKAFVNALEQFQQAAQSTYKSDVNLQDTHTWQEVLERVNQARDKYTGVNQKGILRKIKSGLRGFQTAAPAIEAWLKLLPSTSTYGSVVCGGLTIILEVIPVFVDRSCDEV
ncbi:MAG: hypothetical protein Q9174_005107 [Haloplaca sp. 1 TL-2023]